MKLRHYAPLLVLLTGAAHAQSYTLADFYRYKPTLEHRTDQIFDALTDAQRVGQMIVPAVGRLGKPTAHVAKLIGEGKVGGVLLLNGEKESFTALTENLNDLAVQNGHPPLLFTADAEPSLVNRKISGTTKVPTTAALTDTTEVRRVARTIAADLKAIGVMQNYAPVLDVSPNNEAIGNRSFGSDPARVVEMNRAFVDATQAAGVAATVKHFPGHGLVRGDTHHQLVYIDGEMREVDNYRPLIEAGALSVMVAHIAVQNEGTYDTDGAAASTSRRIVTDLLKEELGFRGVIVTDAMNMGAVSKDADAPLKAVRAGCDMILMPVDEQRLHASVLRAMSDDAALRDQVHTSVRKIIRMKLCLGLME
ncbi:MAG: glycoside hydrolase family 3 N-terminal domain-containing protein [Catalinimonas sp.]